MHRLCTILKHAYLRLFKAFFILCILSGIVYPCHAGENSLTYQMRTTKPFQQVLEDLEFAVSERNFRITNTLNIGKGIQLRGYEDFPENSVVLFCNLKLAKRMLELDPLYLNHCPYRVNLREINNQVIITAMLLPDTGVNAELDQLIRGINDKLIQIVEFGAETWQE